MKRLQIRLREEEYLGILEAARSRQMTVTDWARQALLRAVGHSGDAAEAKLRAIADASRHSFPTADVEIMLSEIEAGQRNP